MVHHQKSLKTLLDNAWLKELTIGKDCAGGGEGVAKNSQMAKNQLKYVQGKKVKKYMVKGKTSVGDRKKNSCMTKSPPPPITFLMVDP